MSSTTRSKSTLPLRGLGLLILSVYCLSVGGHVLSPDSEVMIRVAESLLRGSGGAISGLDVTLDGETLPGGWSDHGSLVGRDGRRYAKYGPGFSVAVMPLYLMGNALHSRLPEASLDALRGVRLLYYSLNSHDTVTRFFASLLNPLICVLTCLCVGVTAQRLGCGRGSAMALILVAALASPLWPYSKSSFSEPGAGLGFAAALLLLCRRESGFGLCGGLIRVALAGAACGAAISFRSASVLFVAPLLLAAIASNFRTRTRKELAGSVLTFLLGASPFLLLIASYNQRRFGVPWESGYGPELDIGFSQPFYDGFLGLLFSPGRGLILYFPLVVLSALGFKALSRRSMMLALLAPVSLVIHLCFYARWYQWEGGWCWGPRFLIPLLPVLVLPLVFLWEETKRNRGVVLVFMLLVGVSFLAAFSGTWMPLTDFYLEKRLDSGGLSPEAYYPLMRWSSNWSPLMEYWNDPFRDYLLFRALSTQNEWLFKLFFTFWFIVGSFATLSVVRGFRRVSQDTGHSQQLK